MNSRRVEDRLKTPDSLSNSPANSRSRKCLDLALRSKETTSPFRGSPLSDRMNLPHPSLVTPTKTTSPAKLVLSSSDRSRSCSPESVHPGTPFTPQPALRMSTLKKVAVESRGIRKAKFSPLIVDKEVPHTPATPVPLLPEIGISSFYSSSTTPLHSSKPTRQAVSLPKKILRRSSSGGSLRRHRTRSAGGGAKRKRVPSHCGHKIKKPKLRHNAESSKVPVKISELPVLSVDLPSRQSPSNPRPSTSKASLNPTSGQLNLSKETKVHFEVKGGQFVFRAKAKTSTTPKTPVRRSPRKAFSPLKADYFSSSVKERGKGKGGKLFSPSGNYLTPDKISPEKRIPSPVKFDSSVEAEEDCNNLSDLITSLAKDQAHELGEGDNLDTEDAGTEFVPQFCAASDNVPDVSAAVSNILNDLSSGDDSIDETEFNSSASSVEATTPAQPTKLFPIFNRSTANAGNNGSKTSLQVPRAKKFLCSTLSENQAVIDAGQKEIGPIVCRTCGSVYTVGDPEDEAQHDQVHSGLMEKLKMPIWKTERIVGQFAAGRVVCVRPGDHSSHWKKVEEALTVVDRDLGFSEVGIRWPDKTKVFLFIADKKIVGFLLAENIDKGFMILPSKDSDGSGKVYCCSEHPQPVMCGISRIWVLADYRRKKVASSLVDCFRSSFFLDHYLKPHEFAFSDPTLNGIEFAASYMKSTKFLVYNR